MPDEIDGQSSREESPSERRVDRIGREAFEAAVTSATKSATQTIAQIHRRRLVTQSALASFCAACVVFAIAAVVVYGKINGADIANARYNCRVLTRVSQIMGTGAPDLTYNGKPEGFLSSDVLLRSLQNQLNNKAKLAPGPLKMLLSDPQTATLERQVIDAQKGVTDYWQNVLATQLAKVASENCQAAVK